MKHRVSGEGSSLPPGNVQPRKKKNRKLLFQISIIILPVFIAMTTAITIAMYSSTVNGFLEAQNSHLDYILKETTERSTYYSGAELDWYLTLWEQDPQFYLQSSTTAELQSFAAREYDYESCEYIDWLRGLPELASNYMGKVSYRTLLDGIRYETEDKNYQQMFLIDLREPYLGMVICEFNLHGEAKTLGDKYEIDLQDHPAIRQMLEDPQPTAVFERVKNFPSEGNYYIGYRPYIVDGEARAAMGIVYSWSVFQDTMSDTVKKAAAVSIGGIIAALIILQVTIFRKSVSPLSRIQKIVRRYTENKDSAEVEAAVAGIKARNEFGLLSDDIADLAREIDYYTKENAALAGERERVAAELDMARDIQSEQLPCEFPAFPDRTEFDIYASMTPAKEVGGDFYDYFFIDSDHLAIVIADVSGKGIPAALFMMMSRMLISNYTAMGMPPHEVLERANDSICKNNTRQMFVTIWLGILEISTGKVTACNAGHEYPIIRKPGGSFELFKDKHNFVVGGIMGKKYKQYEFTLEKGGTLFLYTDGVPEATDAQENMFGTGRLVEALNRDPDGAPEKLLKEIHNAVNSFVGDAPQFDDLTMLGIKLL
ncbi:MAG: serine/threonine-protein phosphatase [Ruminococcus sp.]|nr:serine/threonine-protein phosphatase [Ruminococcus sp.]